MCLTCQGLYAGALKQLGAGTLRLPEPRADWSVVVVELALGFRVVQVWGGISHRAQHPETQTGTNAGHTDTDKTKTSLHIYVQKHDYVLCRL